jgi:hypothetical protein
MRGQWRYHLLCAASAIAFTACALPLSAAPIPFSGFGPDGHPVSATAEFTLNAALDTVVVKLTNTTTTTLDAGELFTGLDFSLGGLTPTLLSDTAIRREVDNAGVFSDTGGAVNITWSLATLGSGVYQLNFNPNAADGIIGPPSGGNYAGANGSIKGNAGHNPFAALMATFELSVPGLEANTPVSISAWRFGTTLGIGISQNEIPEPSTLLIAGMAAFAILARRR